MVEIKKHLPYIGGLVLIIIIMYSGMFYIPNLFSTKCITLGDSRNDFIPGNYNIQESYFEYGEVPLWTHYRMSGAPFMAVGTKPVFYPPFILFMALFGYGGATNFTMIFNALLSAIGMYALAYYLIKSRKAAFISGILYTFSGFVSAWSFNPVEGWGIPYVPLVALFTLLAFQKKDWLLYSVLTALMVGLSFHSGSTVTSLYLGVVFGLTLLFKLWGRQFKKRVLKALLIGGVVLILSFGLIAVKLLPALEFFEITNRNIEYNYETSRGPIYDSIGKTFINAIKGQDNVGELSPLIGIVALLLSLLALSRIKNKNVLFLIGIGLFTILMVTPIPLYYLLWKYVPFFEKQKRIGRMLVVFVMAMAALSGFGAKQIFDFVKKKTKNEKIVLAVFLIIASLALLDLTLFKGYDFKYYTPLEECEAQYMDSPGLQYIAKDPDIFRIKVNEVNGIDHTITGVTRAEGIELTYGAFAAIWVPEYLNLHMSVALRNPAKMWGMLNIKYLTSLTPLNISGFTFEGEFEGCDLCYEPHAGPKYVYKNSLYLPRTYNTKENILVVGQVEEARNLVYGIMTDPTIGFNPAGKSIVTLYGKMNDYPIDLLRKFDYIILTQSGFDQSSIPILQQYVAGGGKLIPNILNNTPSYTLEDLKRVTGSNKGYDEVNKVEIVEYTTNTVTMKLNGQKGLIVYAGPLALFKGWEAYVDGEKTEILRTNGILGGILVDESDKEIFLRYKPREYVIGSYISIATLLVLIIYFVFWFRKRKKSSKKSI